MADLAWMMAFGLHLPKVLIWAWPFSRRPIADRTSNDPRGQ